MVGFFLTYASLSALEFDGRTLVRAGFSLLAAVIAEARSFCAFARANSGRQKVAERVDRVWRAPVSVAGTCLRFIPLPANLRA